jgi:hypothetical protein
VGTPSTAPADNKPDLTKPATKPAATPSAAATAPAQARAKHAAEPSLGQLVNDASTHLSALIHGEIELAKLELRSSVKNAGTGLGLFAAAGVVALFSLIYFFQAIAETLARFLVPRWAAFFIVFGLLLLSAGLFAYIGYKQVKRVRAPARTIKTTRETVDYLKQKRG